MPNVSRVKLTKYHSHSELFSPFPSDESNYDTKILYPCSRHEENICFDTSMKKTGHGLGCFGDSSYLLTIIYYSDQHYLEGLKKKWRIGMTKDRCLAHPWVCTTSLISPWNSWWDDPWRAHHCLSSNSSSPQSSLSMPSCSIWNWYSHQLEVLQWLRQCVYLEVKWGSWYLILK